MKTKLQYYLKSIPTLLFGLKNPAAILAAALGQRPIIRLRDGLKLRVSSVMDIWIAKETCLDHDYAVHGCAIQNGWVVVDIGAAYGDFVTHTAFHHPTAKLIAFEPFAQAYALLNENIALNGLKNVQVFQKAVSSRAEKRMVSQTGAAVQHTTHRVDNAASLAPSKSGLVDAIGLADIFTLTAIQHIDFLKVDCEGAEFDIFLNAAPAELAKIERVCMEYHDNATPHHHSSLVQHFEQHGFRVTTYPNPVHSHLGFLYASKAH
ncbi:MAG: FkbM family methyltransferase [Anaerolineae bacterium]|nr:FkbM family methyltransferase [Anaerolineae bacterium]